MSVNKVIILGRLGQDPELKYTPSGMAVCNFTVATSESWADKAGQKQERTEWHRIVVWGKLAELCNQYLTKGRQAFIEGAIQTRSWDDKNGQKRYTTEIVAKTVQFIGGPSAGAGAGATKEYSGSSQGPGFSGQDLGGNEGIPEYNISTDTNFTSDDIPF